MVGYAKNHEGDCYRMWHPPTGAIYETRDILWLRRMYFIKPIDDPDIVITHQLDELDGEYDK